MFNFLKIHASKNKSKSKKEKEKDESKGNGRVEYETSAYINNKIQI
jgi:hypothetical protein